MPPLTIQLPRQHIFSPNVIAGAVLGDVLIYRVKRRASHHCVDLILGCWHTDRWLDERYGGYTFYAVRDEHDWTLFRIANAILEWDEVEVV